VLSRATAAAIVVLWRAVGLLATAASAALCRPAPHSAVLAPGHAETAGYPGTLHSASLPVSASLPWPPVHHRTAGPRYCCHALPDSRTRGTLTTHSVHSLFLGLRPCCRGIATPHWTPSLSSHCSAVLDPGSAGTAAGPQVVRRSPGPPVHHRIAGPPALVVSYWTPVGSYTLHPSLAWYIIYWRYSP
jgi:hypothetical protein